MELKRTQGNLRELEGSHLNSFEVKEVKRTQENSRELKGTQGNSRELKGTLQKGKNTKKLQKLGGLRKRENFTDIKKRLGLRHERLKINQL